MKQFAFALIAFVAIAGLTLGQAQYTPGTVVHQDDYESYTATHTAPGPGANNLVASQGLGTGTGFGLTTWFNDPNADGDCSNVQAAGGSAQSLLVSGPGLMSSGAGCDLVYTYNEMVASGTIATGAYQQSTISGVQEFPQSGTWEIRAKTYVDSSFPTGMSSCYYIVNDNFNSTAGTATWVGQTKWDHTLGTIQDDQRNTAHTTNIIYDAWVDIVFRADLDNDSASIIYGGTDVGNGPYFVTTPAWNSGTGPMQIANLDLFTVGSAIYFDDVSLVQVEDGPHYQTNSFDATAMSGIDADINGVFGTSTNNATSWVSIAGSPTVNINTNNAVSPGVEAAVDFGPPTPLGLGGSALNTGGGIININLASGTTFYLFGGAAPAFLPSAGGASTLTFAATVPGLDVSIQYVTLDPFAATGLSFSQASQLIVTP